MTLRKMAAILGTATCTTGIALAAGESITVTTLNDRTDVPTSATVDDLPGPDGLVSFREACYAVNNTAGPQRIEFAIPQSEWWLLADVAVLRLERGTFSLTDDGTVVDFTTQTIFTGDTNPDGNEVGIYGLQPNGWGAPAIHISGNDCTVVGLDRVMQRGYGVQIAGNFNRVVGCTISGPLYAGVAINGYFGGLPATGNIVGGTLPGERNILSGGNSGVRIDGPSLDNVVIGNQLSGPAAGIELRGAFDNDPIGTRIGGYLPEERNVIAGAGRYGQEGFPTGAQIALVSAHGTEVIGNYVGTNAEGSARVTQRSPVGISIRNSTDTLIEDNLVSGIHVVGINHAAGNIYGTGVAIAASTGTVMLGNRIGTDATGTLPIPNRAGVGIGSFPGQGTTTDLVFGTTDLGAGNIVAFNELEGVSLGSDVSGITISGNAIFSNGGLGIELQGNANHRQLPPVIVSAVLTGGRLAVQGEIVGPAGTYTVELFGNRGCDNPGEGQTYLGSLVVDGTGNPTAFSATIEVVTDDVAAVTATATRDLTAESSAFSECILVEASLALGDLNCDGAVTVSDINPFVSALTDMHGYKAAFPGCDPMSADINNDGTVSVADINGFVEMLTAQ